MGTQTAQPTSWSEKRMVRLPKACDSRADGCSVVSNLDGIEAGPRCGTWNGWRGGVNGWVRVVALGVRSVGVVSASVASLRWCVRVPRNDVKWTTYLYSSGRSLSGGKLRDLRRRALLDAPVLVLAHLAVRHAHGGAAKAFHRSRNRPLRCKIGYYQF